jgi:hypothetical protein
MAFRVSLWTIEEHLLFILTTPSQQGPNDLRRPCLEGSNPR